MIHFVSNVTELGITSSETLVNHIITKSLFKRKIVTDLVAYLKPFTKMCVVHLENLEFRGTILLCCPFLCTVDGGKQVSRAKGADITAAHQQIIELSASVETCPSINSLEMQRKLECSRLSGS